MKTLNNSKDLKKKKPAPVQRPSGVTGKTGRRTVNNGIGGNAGVPQNRQDPNIPKKPSGSGNASGNTSGNPRPAAKDPQKRPSGKKPPNKPVQPNGSVKGGNSGPQGRPAAPADQANRANQTNRTNQADPAKKTAAPAKPVDKRTRRAADKAAQSKQAAVKRKNKYSGGNYILYYIFAAMVVMLVLTILANTVLFNCKNIIVTGNARYTADEVTADSGLAQGLNLLHVNRKGSAEKIVSALPYIDAAEVKCVFPSTIEVSVTEAKRRFAVQEGAVTAAVSYGGKIVEQGLFSELPLVIGMDVESIETGTWFKSKIDGKNGIPESILDAAESAMMNNISKIDVTDRFSLEMELDNGRIIIRLGTASDMENKVKIAKEFVDTEVGETESVTIIVSNPTRVTLRINVPEEEPGGTSEPEPGSDPSGSPETSSNASSGSESPENSAGTGSTGNSGTASLQ